ncbi:MAG: hypothetical protein QXG86_00850 [Candidatus Woesearchaeota archaeon]
MGNHISNTIILKRKLYRRGSSFETTIPLPLLFALNKTKKHNVLFIYDKEKNRWYIEFEEVKNETNNKHKY